MPENEDKVEVSAPKKKPLPKAKYKAKVGLDYGDTRVEAGEIAEGLPDDSVEWLLEGNYIEKVS